MPDRTHRIAFVVPTKDRPQELRRMLASMARQLVLPDQMIIVDGGDATVEDVPGEFPTLPCEYIRVYPPSLSGQRNAGMRAVKPDTPLAGYLDDDLVLEEGAMAAMLAFWEQAPPDVGGAAFNLANERLPEHIWIKRIFLLQSHRRGVILRSGFESSLWPVQETVYPQWLCGGATIWRREVIERFAYDEWFVGTGMMEDIDYSHRVGKLYHLAIVADARVQHLSPWVIPGRNYLLGKWQAINRAYFVWKNPELSRALYAWAMVGQILLNLGRLVKYRDLEDLWRACGNVVGLTRVALGRFDRLAGTIKS